MKSLGLILLATTSCVVCWGQLHQHVTIPLKSHSDERNLAPECLQEPYYIDPGVTVSAHRCGYEVDDKDSYVLEVHPLGNSTIATKSGLTVIDTAFQFGATCDFDLLRFANAEAFDVSSVMSVGDTITQNYVGTKDDLTYEGRAWITYDRYSGWEVTSDTTFNYQGLDWLPARQITLKRISPPAGPLPPGAEGQYRLLDLEWSIRIIVDTHHKRAFALSGDARWFDTLHVDP